MQNVIAVALAYLLGSIPFAFLLTRTRGVDLRRVGSRNLGAANVLRTAGVVPAVMVLMFDAGKGAFAVLVADVLTDDPTVVMAAGLAAIAGHIYPVWLRFRGGKGVATAAGVFGMLSPFAMAIAAIVFVGTIFVTRFVSAGSVVAAVTLPAVAAATNVPGPVVTGAVLSALIIIHRHRDNLARLVAGTERRIGLRL